MDDGSYNKIKNHLIICTDSYSKEDVLRLISVLQTKFNLSCGLISINKNNTKKTSPLAPEVAKIDLNYYYRIRINKSSMPTLINIVKPYFIPSMLYKLGLSKEK